MVESPISPGRRSVAGGAISAEFAIVPVVLGMTTDARRRRADVPPAWVTRAAGRLGVGAGQGEAGPGMGEGEVLPTARQVAVDAIARELPAVWIVSRVAAPAAAADRPLPLDMARPAGHLRVQPRKRKARPVVVEGGAVPALRRVALVTRCPQAADVNVVGPVALEALGRRGAQGGQGARRPMAEDAFRFAMASHQRKSSMVEGGAVGVDSIVAIEADRAEGHPVLDHPRQIEQLVAGEAGRRRERSQRVGMTVLANEGAAFAAH